MPQELPGFYYDAEKNRYFLLKGPIPGSFSSSSGATPKPPGKANHPKAPKFAKNKIRPTKSQLLCGRELNGNVITSNKKRKCNFFEEFQKIQASQPVAWKYQGTEKIADAGLEQTYMNVQTPQGQTQVDVLITGGRNGYLSFFELGKHDRHFDNGVKCIPDRVWPIIEENKERCNKAPGYIWKLPGPSLCMHSEISCVKSCGKHSPYTVDDGLNACHALVTTLGSEAHGGSVCICNLADPIDFHSRIPTRQMLHEIASFNCTIWTVDCNHNASEAMIGTNLGAALVNLETGTTSWVCKSKSDILALQLVQSGNVALCGLRNGAIVTVDVREKQERFPARLIRHRIPYSSLGRSGRNSTKKWFELKGNIHTSRTIYMTSSVSCLVSLQSYDQYFLASSMDGLIKLYDHRMTKRGTVQSYEGHVNSHSRIQLGVDEYERFLMAGGEDCHTRIWSIKSGELLFEEKLSDTVPLTVCWQRAERISRIPSDEGESREDCYSWGAWFGSEEGLFYMHGL